MQCDGIFYVLPSRSKRKFCSIKCHNAYQVGKKKTGNYKANSGSFKKGNPSWIKGKTTSEETKQKQREAKLKKPVRHWLGKDRKDLSGEKNCNWKGEEAGYCPKHAWVKRQRGRPDICDECGKRGKTQWSNKDHKYRRVLEDYRALCASCHKKYDIKNNSKAKINK